LFHVVRLVFRVCWKTKLLPNAETLASVVRKLPLNLLAATVVLRAHAGTTANVEPIANVPPDATRPLLPRADADAKVEPNASAKAPVNARLKLS